LSYTTILVRVEHPYAILTINRPPMNPLNSLFFEELPAAAGELAADPEIRVLIITGAGEKAFAAGADVHAMNGLDEAAMYAMGRATVRAMQALNGLSVPVIAAVNGFALGGGLELALACDLRIAGDTARFGLPEINLGIIPGGGGTQRLPRLIGIGPALELMMTGDMINAARAAEIGLVHRVVPGPRLMDEARETAVKLAAKPAFALGLLKSAVYGGFNLDLPAALDLEMKTFLTAFAGADRREGFAAFLEKRTPRFSGR
jgi:enoyl-CoA hydratase